MEAAPESIRPRPFGPSPRAVLTCSRNNAAALHLYEIPEFLPTGRQEDGEVELAKNV